MSEIPGTTRDTIEATLTIGDFLFRLIDTAGLRETDDLIEQAGIERARKAIENAAINILVIDCTQKPGNLPREAAGADFILLNKSDLKENYLDEWYEKLGDLRGVTHFSTRNRDAIAALKHGLMYRADKLRNDAGDLILTSERHRLSLEQAHTAILEVESALDQCLPMDMLTQHLRAAIEAIGQVTGQAITTPALLRHIFEHFCIGK